MVDSYGFRLLTQEEIMSQMARYLSGHTEFINDFNEGSITRSLIESVSQEMFRQNLTYAQGISEAIRSSTKQAFNQPLLEATKAYGSLSLNRKLLPSPSSLTVMKPIAETVNGYTSTVAVTGYIVSPTFTVVSIITPTQTDHPNPQTKLLNSIYIGQSISGTDANTQIIGFGNGTGGVGTYTINNSQTVASSASPQSFTLYGTLSAPFNFGVSSVVSSGTLPSNTYFWSITAVYGTRESAASSPVAQYLSSSSNVVLTWTANSLATSYYIYRSTNKYMFNSVGFSVGSGATSTVTDTSSNVSIRQWPGTSVCYAVTTSNTTLGTTRESTATSLLVSPAKPSVGLLWPAVTSIDSSSAPTFYSTYRADYDYSVPTTGLLSVTASATGTVLSTSATYYYKVTALTGATEGTPTSLYGSFVPTTSYRTAYLSWTEVSGAIGYRIYRATTPLPNTSNLLPNFTSCSFYDNYSTNTYFFDNGSLMPLSGTTGSVPISYRVTTFSSLYYQSLNDISPSPAFLDNGLIGSVSSPPDSGTAFSVSGPLSVPSGTQFSIPNTQKIYATTASYSMPASDSSVAIIAQSLTYGTSGNTPAGTITNFVTPLSGFSSATNAADFLNGRDVETEEEWRIRFNQTLAKLSRGTLDSIKYGLLSTSLVDTNGFIYESVKKSYVYEPSTNVVNAYVHNGSLTSSPSSALIATCQQIINGYIDNSGTVIPGYKPAGIPVTVYGANIQPQNVSVSIVSRAGYPISLLTGTINQEVTSYFSSLDISNGLGIASFNSIIATTAGTTSYQYQVVGLDSFRNTTYPSAVYPVDTGASTPNNTLVINVPNTSFAYFDILRWTGQSWGLVATISAGSSSTVTYVDTSVSTSSYVFSTSASSGVFNSSVLQSRILKINGVLSATLIVPDSNGYHQETIQPIIGSIVVAGTITIK